MQMVKMPWSTSLPYATNEITDLVWLQTGFLGDIVLTTAAMNLVAKEFPSLRQHLITTSVGCAALEQESLLNSVTVLQKKRAPAWRAFKAVKENLSRHLPMDGKPVLLQPHLSFRSSFLSLYLKIPTITYVETWFNWFAIQKVPRVAVLHEATRIALLLEPLGVDREKITTVRPQLTPGELSKNVPWQRQIMAHSGRLVGVAAGSVWSTKRWPVEHFINVAENLLRADDIGLVFLGNQADKVSVDEIVSALPSCGRVWNLAGKTSLDDLRGVVGRLSLLISNDSSPIHYASAFNIPTLGIFGSTIPEMGFAPLADLSDVAQTPLNCRPCSDHGPNRCPLSHFRCMRELMPEAVLEKALGLLIPAG